MSKANDNYIRVGEEDLKTAIAAILKRNGVPSDQAAIVGDVLVAAELRGIETHGVGRLKSYYIWRLQNGYMNPEPKLQVERNYGATFVLDADNGLGHPACHAAMKRCIELAEQYGVGMGGVKNSNHYGIAGYYSMMALEKNMIGVCLTNAQPLIIPTYSKRRLLGSNPISIAVPAGKEPAFVLDMATSVVPYGEIQVHKRKKMAIPQNWGADSRGKPTTDPSAVINGGGLLPLGGSAADAGYKGYGLSAAVDILSGVLTGASFLSSALSSQESADPCGIGHFVAAVKTEAFIDPDEFKTRMDSFIKELKSAPLADDCERIYVAGEKEFMQWEENRKNGVPVHETVWEELIEMCHENDVNPPVVL